MRKDVKIDSREIRCPNSSLIGSNRAVARPGDCILYKEEYDNGTGTIQSRLRLARVLGRVSAPEIGAGKDRTPEVKGWALVMAMSDNHRYVYERWVNPEDIREVFDPSPKLAAFFNSPVVSADVREAVSKQELSEGNLSHGNDGTFKVRVPESGQRDVAIGDDGRFAGADLVAAAKLVLERWERGDLAEAVRELDAAVRGFEAAPHQYSRPFRQTLSDGTKLVEWKNFDGRTHREDGPAIEWEDGKKEWYLDGKRHRDGGPAIERPDGRNEWYRDGQRYSRLEELQAIRESMRGWLCRCDNGTYDAREPGSEEPGYAYHNLGDGKTEDSALAALFEAHCKNEAAELAALEGAAEIGDEEQEESRGLSR